MVSRVQLELIVGVWQKKMGCCEARDDLNREGEKKDEVMQCSRQ